MAGKGCDLLPGAWSRLLAATLVFVGCEGAQAATEPTDPASPTLAEIEVVGHYDNGVGTSNAASQGVVLGNVLQDIPLLRPGEVLETIPGLVVTQHSGEGKANQYFLRGYNLDHGTDFAVSVDGVPVNMPTHGHGQGYADLNFLIPELVQRIDYRKGPYFARNGDFSSAGSADIHYRDRLDRDVVELTLGEGGYRRLLTAAATALGSAAAAGSTSPTLLGAAEAVRNDGPWAAPEGMRKRNALLRFSAGDAERGGSVSLQAYDARWRSTDQVPLELIESGALCRYCSLDPSDGGRTSRVILSAEWHRQDESRYLRVSAYAEQYRLQLWSDFTYHESDPVHADQFEQRDARHLYGGQIAVGCADNWFGRESATEAGVQVRHDRIHVSLFDTQARVPFARASEDQVIETEAALYVENTAVWSPWLRTLAGVRADAIRLDLSSRAYPQTSGRASAARASPKLALILGPWANTELFVNAGNGFHSNDARGVVGRFDPATGDSRTRAPALVGSRGMEIGLRSQIVPGLQSSLALWSLDSASELVYAADSGGTDINAASRRHGVEWNNHWLVGDWLLFDADLAWTHARYAERNANGESGNRIPNAVGRVASIGVGVRRGPWAADIKWRYFGGYPLTQDAALRAPAASVTNLRLRRELNDRAAVSLDGLNLFDRRYFDIAYGQDYRVAATSASVPVGTTVHPGEPRQWRVTLQVRF